MFTTCGSSTPVLRSKDLKDKELGSMYHTRYVLDSCHFQVRELELALMVFLVCMASWYTALVNFSASLGVELNSIMS